jgi:hypothetical protein
VHDGDRDFLGLVVPRHPLCGFDYVVNAQVFRGLCSLFDQIKNNLSNGERRFCVLHNTPSTSDHALPSD